MTADEISKASRCILVVLAALAVTACGLRGNLDRPEPMWGEPQVDVEESVDEDEDEDERDGHDRFFDDY